MFFDRAGKPMDGMDWAAKFEDMSDRRSARTEVKGFAVSTIWLGLDHRYGDGPPLIYETQVFGLDGVAQNTWRYATEEAALSKHKKAVADIELREPE